MQDTTTSGPLDGEPSRRRRLRQAVTGLSILIVAFALFAWQQGGDGEGDGPLNAIAEAAERTQGESGGRATMRAIVSSPAGSESFTMTGEMVFNDETGRSRAVLTIPRSESSRFVKMQMIGDGTVMYLRSSRFGELPGGREWMALDFSSLGPEMDTPLPTNGDAKGELELLEAATGDVQKLGKEDVRGVPTTRYRGTVDASENVEWLREEGAEDLASRIEEGPLQVEAWIDADGLIRRMRFVKSEPREGGEGPMTIDMRMDFYDFGISPEIDVPESSEVFDATSLAKDEIGLSGGD
ncbi:MAG TPA: hypothetical protein VID51_06170 [Solirubrobacterales bacterium]